MKTGRIASAAGNPSERKDAITATPFAQRLRTLIGKTSVSAFARQCGLAESVLRTYLNDGRMPPLDKAYAIATAAGVSVDWLASGCRATAVAEVRASYDANGATPASAIDVAVLKDILRAVIKAQGAYASPEQLAERAGDLYQRVLQGFTAD